MECTENELKFSLMGEFAEGKTIHMITFEKMGIVVTIMQRYRGSTVILGRILVIRAIFIEKLGKTGFMSKLWVNTCSMDVRCEMRLQIGLRGPGLQSEFAWVAEWNIGVELDVIHMRRLRKSTK